MFFVGVFNHHAKEKIVITLNGGTERFFHPDYLIEDVIKFWSYNFQRQEPIARTSKARVGENPEVDRPTLASHNSTLSRALSAGFRSNRETLLGQVSVAGI
jgi:hypothetical protein